MNGYVYPVPRDWRIMKTAAKVIKYVLNDGGFKIFAAKCGHKEDISQWQDIHNILLGTYEASMKSAVEEHRIVDKDTSQIRISGSG